MNKIPYSQIKRGTLLIATPNIQSGLFYHGVILLCEHGSTGSFGLLINKPLNIDIPQEIFDIHKVKNQRISICSGGPVQTNQMMLLHNYDLIPDQTFQVSKGIYLGGDLTFLQKSIENINGPAVHLCFGYAGWGRGELEHEFLEGNWLLHPSSPHHIFDIPPENLWPSLLRDMGGKYATLSMIPEDLSLN